MKRKSNQIFYIVKRSGKKKETAQRRKENMNKQNFLSRNTFWFAPPFVSILTSSQRSRKNERKSEGEERKMLISCFDGYERILWCEMLGENFLQHNRAPTTLCVFAYFYIVNKHFSSFLLSLTKFNITRNVLVSESECSSVKRQERKKKIEFEQVARHS